MRIPILLGCSLVVCGCTSTELGPNEVRVDDPMPSIAFEGCRGAYDIGPILRKGKSPKYPVKRLLAEEEGYSHVSFVVEEDGTVSSIKRVEDSHPAFYASGRAALEDWVFEPARLNGVPVRATCEYRQEFFLK